jgi:hypothetical protein
LNSKIVGICSAFKNTHGVGNHDHPTQAIIFWSKDGHDRPIARLDGTVDNGHVH